MTSAAILCHSEARPRTGSLPAAALALALALALGPGGRAAHAQAAPATKGQASAGEPLHDSVTAALRGLLGEPGPRGWLVRHEGHRFDAQLAFAQVVPEPENRQILVVLTASPREFYAGRATPELVQLLLLRRDDSSRDLAVAASSRWLPLGDNGRTPSVVGLARLGADRHAAVIRSTETWQGAIRADYFLLAPRLDRQGFVTLGRFGVFARLCQGTMKPAECWTTRLEIDAEPPAGSSTEAACWPLRIVTQKVSDTGRSLATRTDRVPCTADGSYRTPKAFEGPFF